VTLELLAYCCLYKVDFQVENKDKLICDIFSNIPSNKISKIKRIKNCYLSSAIYNLELARWQFCFPKSRRRLSHTCKCSKVFIFICFIIYNVLQVIECGNCVLNNIAKPNITGKLLISMQEMNRVVLVDFSLKFPKKCIKGPSIKDVRTQGEGIYPVRTFCGQGGSSDVDVRTFYA